MAKGMTTTPPKGKEKSDRTNVGARGGSGNHMSGPNTAGPQKPGQTTSMGQKSGNNTFKETGGSGHMFGHMAAGPAMPGYTGKCNTSDGGKFAKGGTTHMFGPQQASPAKPA